jgi:O-methyltransferase involved in polyketide biosynthesis
MREAPMRPLEGVSATLLLALAARALAPIDAPQLNFRDPVAQRILREMRIDPRRYELRKLEVRSVILRAQWFADKQRDFFEHYPDAVALNFGCGLSASYEQVADAGGGRFSWYDFDLEPVIAIRRRYFADTLRRRTLIRDAAGNPFYRIPWRPERPALIIAEGLLYYLRPAEVAAFLRAAVRTADERGSHLEIVFDYASAVGARFLARRPAHRQLGTAYDWTMRRCGEITAIEPRLQIVEDSNLFIHAMGLASRAVNTIHRAVTGGSLGGCMHLRLAPATST